MHWRPMLPACAQEQLSIATFGSGRNLEMEFWVIHYGHSDENQTMNNNWVKSLFVMSNQHDFLLLLLFKCLLSVLSNSIVHWLVLSSCFHAHPELAIFCGLHAQFAPCDERTRVWFGWYQRVNKSERAFSNWPSPVQFMFIMRWEFNQGSNNRLRRFFMIACHQPICGLMRKSKSLFKEANTSPFETGNVFIIWWIIFSWSRFKTVSKGVFETKHYFIVDVAVFSRSRTVNSAWRNVRGPRDAMYEAYMTVKLCWKAFCCGCSLFGIWFFILTSTIPVKHYFCVWLLVLQFIYFCSTLVAALSSSRNLENLSLLLLPINFSMSCVITHVCIDSRDGKEEIFRLDNFSLHLAPTLINFIELLTMLKETETRLGQSEIRFMEPLHILIPVIIMLFYHEFFYSKDMYSTQFDVDVLSAIFVALFSGGFVVLIRRLMHY